VGLRSGPNLGQPTRCAAQNKVHSCSFTTRSQALDRDTGKRGTQDSRNPGEPASGRWRVCACHTCASILVARLRGYEVTAHRRRSGDAGNWRIGISTGMRYAPAFGVAPPNCFRKNAAELLHSALSEDILSPLRFHWPAPAAQFGVVYRAAVAVDVVTRPTVQERFHAQKAVDHVPDVHLNSAFSSGHCAMANVMFTAPMNTAFTHEIMAPIPAASARLTT
jgi:hypothetical protein